MMPCNSMWYHWILCDITTHIIHCSTAPSQGQLPDPPASPCSQGCPRPPVPPAPQYWDLSVGQSAHPVGVWGMKVIKKVRGILTVLTNTVTVVIQATYTEDIPPGYTTQVLQSYARYMYTPWLYNPSIQSYALTAKIYPLLSKSSILILIRVHCNFLLILQLRVNRINDWWYNVVLILSAHTFSLSSMATKLVNWETMEYSLLMLMM